jgi:fatty-acyl-CoA synthase
LFADIVQDWAERQGTQPALVSDTENFHLWRARRAHESLRPLGARFRHQAGRHGLSADADAARSCRGLARHQPSRRRRGADQYQAGRASLAHGINVADADHIIVANELADVFEAARPHLDRAPKVWTDASLGAVLETLDGSPLSPDERSDVTINDRC